MPSCSANLKGEGRPKQMNPQRERAGKISRPLWELRGCGRNL